MVLSKQGWNSPTGLPFTAARVRGIRERAEIPRRAASQVRRCGRVDQRGRPRARE